MPFLFGLAPGGVYRAATVTSHAVRSYRTVSTLPGPKTRRFIFCGTVPGVAPAGRYPAPFLAGARTFLPSAVTHKAAVARPSGPARLEAKRAARNSCLDQRRAFGHILVHPKGNPLQ
jgi:hypothetical protein